MTSKLLSKSNQGFTLIEVLIAVVIMAFISVAIFQTTTRSFSLRAKLGDSGTFNNEIQMAMGLMERDVGLMYSPTIFYAKAQRQSQAQTQQSYGEQEEAYGRPSQYWGAPLDPTGIRPMRFVGKESEFSFVSASNIRVYKETAESEFAKIKYALEPDAAAEADGYPPGTKVLVRTVSGNAFELEDDRDKSAKQYRLVRGISKLQVRYYQKPRDRWWPNWDSDVPDFKRVYPDLIEITLEVTGPNRLHWEGLYKLRTELPFRGLETTL